MRGYKSNCLDACSTNNCLQWVVGSWVWVHNSLLRADVLHHWNDQNVVRQGDPTQLCSLRLKHPCLALIPWIFHQKIVWSLYFCGFRKILKLSLRSPWGHIDDITKNNEKKQSQFTRLRILLAYRFHFVLRNPLITISRRGRIVLRSIFV